MAPENQAYPDDLDEQIDRPLDRRVTAPETATDTDISPRDTMAERPIIYEWECPICGISRVGLSPRARLRAEDQARNAIEGHVRMEGGNGHGGAGELPPEFSAETINEYVRFKEQFGRHTPESSR